MTPGRYVLVLHDMNRSNVWVLGAEDVKAPTIMRDVADSMDDVEIATELREQANVWERQWGTAQR